MSTWRQGSDSSASNLNYNGWNRRSSILPRSVNFQEDVSGGTQDPWLYEDRVRTGPFGLPSFLEQPPPVRFLVLDNEMARAVNPTLRQFVQESPRQIMNPLPMQLPPQEPESRFESRLTQEEQKGALKKLKKQTYTPERKKIWSLYYRDNVVNDFKKANDEAAKRCAICLDDFVPNQEVLVTPCSHMFHDECITPWVKINGQCPVCRFALYEQRRDNVLPRNTNNNIPVRVANVMEELDLTALIRFYEFLQ